MRDHVYLGTHLFQTYERDNISDWTFRQALAPVVHAIAVSTASTTLPSIPTDLAEELFDHLLFSLYRSWTTAPLFSRLCSSL